MAEVYPNPKQPAEAAAPPVQQPPPEAQAPPEAQIPPAAETSGRRGSWRRFIPWLLLTVVVLAVLPTLIHRLTAAQRAASHPASALTPEPAAPPAAFVPLTVTLYSAGSGRHIRVGMPITISAFAGLPPGESATVAVSYTKDDGAKRLLSLAQGSLSSTSWTPTAAGRYQFTASALDSHKVAAFSRPLTVWVDAPRAAAKRRASPPPKAAIAGLPLRLTSAPPARKLRDAQKLHGTQKLHAASVQPPALGPARRSRGSEAAQKTVTAQKAVMAKKAVTAKKAVAAKKAAAVAKTSAVKKSAAQMKATAAYHVAAARFTYQPVAETLAGALRHLGFHAFVRAGSDARGKRTYAVETGAYTRPEDARRQEAQLRQDGYPAFHYRSR